jgi:NAD(P)-dependent dehydrogenase (short-subunit alcohol dehydrogenase family)
MTKPVCVVVGVGEGNGAALARGFAAEGMAVALLARGTEFTSALAGELGDAKAYACDVADPAAIADAFARIRSDLGEPATLVTMQAPAAGATSRASRSINSSRPGGSTRWAPSPARARSSRR